MIDLIVSLVIIAILALAIAYIYMSRKQGLKCIGCPDSATCQAKNTKGCMCNSLDQYRQDRDKCNKCIKKD